MAGRFFGKNIHPQAIGGKGFFGSPAAAPAVATGFVVETALGVPQGFSFPFIGWDGNNGVLGPGSTGVLISGNAAVWGAGQQFSFGDAQAGGFPPGGGVPPLFTITTSGVEPQNFFTSVNINGHTYLSAAASFFSNGGGCGPTIWEFASPAGLTDATQYPAVFA